MTLTKKQRLKGAQYLKTYCPLHPNCDSKGYMKTHRLFMENKLGRYLTKEEDVHHINGNKKDNRIENLQVISKAEHQKLHRTGAKVSLETKLRISTSKKGVKTNNIEHYKKQSVLFTGKKMSQEFKDKIKASWVKRKELMKID